MLLGSVGLDRVPGTSIPLSVPFVAESPGELHDTLGTYQLPDGKKRQIVAIDGLKTYPTSGALYMTTVQAMFPLSIREAVATWFSPDANLVPLSVFIPPGSTREDTVEENRKAFETSEDNAALAALNYLKLDDAVRAVKKDRAAINAKKAAEQAQRNEQNDQNEQDSTQEDQPAAEVVNGPVRFFLPGIGGGSAGLMFSLAVIDKLTPGELTAGKKIAGTGVITEKGDVQPIGGVLHKIEAASQVGATVFLVPADNCVEAATTKRDITLVRVTNLDSAVNALKNLKQGLPVEECRPA